MMYNYDDRWTLLLKRGLVSLVPDANGLPVFHGWMPMTGEEYLDDAEPRDVFVSLLVLAQRLYAKQPSHRLVIDADTALVRMSFDLDHPDVSDFYKAQDAIKAIRKELGE